MTYVDAGYAVALVVLLVYALSLVGRERAARRRLGPPPAGGAPVAPTGGAPTAGGAER